MASPTSSRSLAAALLGLLLNVNPVAAQPEATQSVAPLQPGMQQLLDEREANKDERMAWWRDARFGMFIHWGVYAVPAGSYQGKQVAGIGEWIMQRAKIPVDHYATYAERFNPVKYDPDSWVRLAKEAGMKYIIITAKHHDGFALFDSAVTDYDVVDSSPYQKDLLRPLAEACRKHGVKLGFYYSQAQDWRHPGGAKAGGGWDPKQDGSMDDYIRTVALPQSEELLGAYPELAVFWWDTPIDMNRQRAMMLLPALAKNPRIIMNNRLGGGFAGDTDTPEQHIPATGLGDRDFEVCMTMNDTWGFKSHDDKWKPTEVLIRNLVDIASKGGNYLLNVGPTAEGEIPAPSVERLQAIGAWMRTNGESIYGSTASPFAYLPWGRCTVKRAGDETKLFLQVFDWPADGTLVAPKLANDVRSARLLDGGEALEFLRSGEDMLISVPAQAPDAICSVIELTIDGLPEVGYLFPTQGPDGEVTVAADQLLIHNNDYVEGNQARLRSVEGSATVTNWKSKNDRLECVFKLLQPGAYRVLIVSRGEQPTQLKLSGPKGVDLVAKVAPSGRFEPQELGEITLTNVGEQNLSISPVGDGWKPIDVRSVRLEKRVD